MVAQMRLLTLANSNRFLAGVLLFCCALYVALIHNMNSGEKEANQFHKTNFYINDTWAIYKETSTYKAAETKTKVRLVILVLSKPSHNEQRMVIRYTWGLQLPETVRIAFVIGTEKLLNETKTTITEEQSQQKDLLLLPNLVDSYSNLTVKVLQAMRWAYENVIFDYLLKADDDTFVRVEEVLKRLQTKPTERLYWGFFNNGSVIVKEGKWAEPKPYICDRYVSYALGGGYVLSRDLVAYVANNADKFKTFNNEDVSVGTWLAPLEVNAVHDEYFGMSGGCTEGRIVVHYSSVMDMISFNYSLAKYNSLCGSNRQENKTHVNNTSNL